MIRLAVFDLAGTTVYDPGAVVDCLVGAIEAAGFQANRAHANGLMGIPKPIAIAQLAPDADVAAVFSDFRRRMRTFYETSDQVRELDGAVEVFARLRAAGVRVATDTGFDREVTEAIFRRLGWEGRLDDSVCSDEVPRGRPYPDMIHLLMRRAGLDDPAQVAKIGDTPSDLQMGTTSGCGLVIGTLNGTHDRSQLEAHPHTHLVPSVREAADLIVRHGQA